MPMMMYPYLYPPMPTPGYMPPSSAPAAGAQPPSQLNTPPLLDPSLQQQQQQMLMQMRMMYPYLFQPMYMPGYAPPPATQPPSQLSAPPQQEDSSPQLWEDHSQPPQEQQQQQLPMYAPWSAAAPQHPPSAILTSDLFAPGTFLSPASIMPPPPTTALGYAQGTPTVHLGLKVAVASTRKILTCYALLFLFLLATGLILLGAWCTPASRDHLFFTRPTPDVMESDTYARFFGGATGKMLSTYAHYAPCTVLKQHGCTVLTQRDILYWLANITNGMQDPFPDIFVYSNVSDGILSSCEYFSRPALPTHLPANHVNGSLVNRTVEKGLILPSGNVGVAPILGTDNRGNDAFGSAEQLELSPEDVDPETPANRSLAPREIGLVLRHRFWHAPEVPTLPKIMANKTGIRMHLHSTFPEGVRARFLVTCNTDRETTDMLKLARVLRVNLTDIVPANHTGTAFPLSAYTLFTATPNSPISYTFNTSLPSCAHYYIYCEDPSVYVLLASANELRRCGGGSVVANATLPDALVTVVVCDVVPREIGVDPRKNGDLLFTARGVFSMHLTVGTRSVKFPDAYQSFDAGLSTSAVVFIIAHALVLVSMVLLATAACLIPVQRCKLHRLRAALEEDAAVAMAILYRAQGALTGPLPPVAASATAADSPVPHDDSNAGRSGSEGGRIATASALAPAPDASMYVASPFYRPAAGTEVVRVGDALMVLAPHPHMQMQIHAPQTSQSPYGEGHYLSQSGEEAEAEEASALVRTVGLRDAPEPDEHRRSSSSSSSISSGSEKGGEEEDDAAFMVPEGVVSPTEIVLPITTPARANPQQQEPGQDAHELESLPSTASPPPPSEQADSDEGGEARLLRSVAVIDNTRGNNSHHRSSSSTGSAPARLHASPLSPPPPEEQLQHYPLPQTLPALRSAGAVPEHGGVTPTMPPAQQHPPALQATALPNTDWMFTQTRHLVSPEALEESAPATPHSRPTRSRLQRLRDRVLHRRSASEDGASVRANFPGSSTDEEDRESDDAAADRHYAAPESSPGERTIQLFVMRARNSYRRTRRAQVHVLRTVFLYMHVVAILDAVFIILVLGFQLSGVFVDFPGRLQLRYGDTLTMKRRVDSGHLAQLIISTVLSIAVVAVSLAIRWQRVW
ncbi:hypothetical protein ABB37_05914 [Leptomonas pyrrhocoris]|uniref:Transmembrane protein n=1 Tax=Leptomonas pyrrhocoris TaxID=157538 RepID=A0A0M9FZ10_LEPPY|nr:hypothetical protein ABB37_05914 [Leptomonas pyrrhocoris]KPA78827.1 hypothetical protein ABB37_05914 [Leptomonas pyrrhocoris]|eukprot:XP_015657266.1 hypothetical protein ABB37_05914 [Leptomonas pyrrhocoris]